MKLQRKGILVAAIITVVAAGVLGAGIADAVTRSGSSIRSGSLPAFLPRTTDDTDTDTTVTGTVARPALTSEGDAVDAVLPRRRGSVRITIAGPVVPGEGLPFQSGADTATWTVSMSGATAPIPIARGAFSVIDSRGNVYTPQFIPGEPRPPATLLPGHTTRFRLRVVLAVGEGMMRWAPVDRDLLGTWDFVVEND